MIGIGEPLYHNDNNGSPSGNLTQSSEMQLLPFENGKVSSMIIIIKIVSFFFHYVEIWCS